MRVLNIIHGVVRYKNAIPLLCLFLFIENLTFPSSISFPINMEGSKRTTIRIGHPYSSTKSKKKNKKDTTLWQKICFPTIYQIALSSLWLQLMGKPVALVVEMEQQVYLKENQGLYTTCSCNLYQVSLKSG